MEIRIHRILPKTEVEGPGTDAVYGYRGALFIVKVVVLKKLGISKEENF